MFARYKYSIAACAVLTVVCALAILLWERRSEAQTLLRPLVHLHWPWLLAALAAQAVSMTSLANSQRKLLHAAASDGANGTGRRLPLASAVAVVFASTALASSVPVAGGGIGAAYSFRQYRNCRVEAGAVSWALTIYNVVAALTFALLTMIGSALSNDRAAAALGLGGAAVNSMPVLALLAAVRFARVRARLVRVVGAAVALHTKLLRRPESAAAATTRSFESMVERTGSIRATKRQYTFAAFMSLRNWVASCVCLAMSIKATGAHIPLHGLVLAYCLAIMASSTGLTPGGLGVVEATLTAGLVAAGLPAKQALPAVLLYRLISLWAVLLIGWVVAAWLRRARPALAQPAPADSPGPELYPGPGSHACLIPSCPGPAPAAMLEDKSGPALA
jgi:putative heme transporter